MPIQKSWHTNMGQHKPRPVLLCQYPGCLRIAVVEAVMFDVGKMRLCRGHENINLKEFFEQHPPSAGGAKPMKQA